jgi:hypothetical protein
MDYVVGEEKVTYSISYQELKEHHRRIVSYTDKQFMKNLPEVAHVACVISWFKELSRDMTIGDRGIVHEIIHLMDIGKDYQQSETSRIREMFETYLKLD